MLRPKIKTRTVHRDRYDGNLAAVCRSNGLDLLDRTTADQSDVLAEYAAEEAEREAHIERQAVMTMVRAEVETRRAREDEYRAVELAEEQARWALELADEEGKVYALNGIAGLVEQRRNRRLGVLVGLYHGDQ